MNSSKFQPYWEDMWILLNFPEYDISMGESHYISEQKPHKKIRVNPATNWLVTLAYDFLILCLQKNLLRLTSIPTDQLKSKRMETLWVLASYHPEHPFL